MNFDVVVNGLINLRQTILISHKIQLKSPDKLENILLSSEQLNIQSQIIKNVVAHIKIYFDGEKWLLSLKKTIFCYQNWIIMFETKFDPLRPINECFRIILPANSI